LVDNALLVLRHDISGLMGRFRLSDHSRVVDEYGNSTEKIKDKETYHRLDALRYGIQIHSEMGGIHV
jgi:hypothetical protein